MKPIFNLLVNIVGIVFSFLIITRGDYVLGSSLLTINSLLAGYNLYRLLEE